MFSKLIPTLTEEDSATLKGYLKAKSAPKGTLLVEQGAEDQDLFMLFDGRYEIYQKRSLSGRTLALHLATLEGPIMLGEANLLMHQKRSASVLISEDAKYFLLERASFVKLQQDHPHIALKILTHAGAVVTERFTAMQERMYTTLLEDCKTVDKALHRLQKVVQNATFCPPEIAKKLFNANEIWMGVQEQKVKQGKSD